MRLPGLLVIGGGITAIATAAFANRRADAVAKATVASVATGGAIKIRVTGYWPFQTGLNATERKMEGGVHDRKGNPLHTVEDFFAGNAEWVSLSGDDSAWPYGQKLVIPWTDGRQIIGRVVDTGRNFRGSTKVYRAMGAEPIDVCVASSKTIVPRPPIVSATIIKGDTLDKASKAIAMDKFQGQTVVGEGGACVYCSDGYHNLCDGADDMGPCACRCHSPSSAIGDSPMAGLDFLGAT